MSTNMLITDETVLKLNEGDNFPAKIILTNKPNLTKHFQHSFETWAFYNTGIIDATNQTLAEFITDVYKTNIHPEQLRDSWSHFLYTYSSKKL